MNRQARWRATKDQAYHDEQNEKVKVYQSTIMGKLALRAAASNGAARRRGNSDYKLTNGDLLDLIFKQNKWRFSVRCAICKTETEEWVVDHRLALSLGGRHEKRNLQILCNKCSDQKSSQERSILKNKRMREDLDRLIKHVEDGETDRKLRGAE